MANALFDRNGTVVGPGDTFWMRHSERAPHIELVEMIGPKLAKFRWLTEWVAEEGDEFSLSQAELYESEWIKYEK